MRFTFAEPEVFGKLFECVSKFVDKAHFDINENEIRVRSIDPDDFCYVDLLLKKSFFNPYETPGKSSFGIDVSKFSKFLPSLASAQAISMIVDGNSLVLEAAKDWVMQFKVNFLEQDPYDLPEPKRFKYEAFAEIPSKEFSKLVNTASTISSELTFKIDGKHFAISASSGDYSFSGKPSKIANVENGGGQSVSAAAIASYIKTLAGLINKCEKVVVRLGNDKPIWLDLKYKDKGVFSFLLSHKRKGAHANDASDRDGTSLPRLTVTKLPELLLYLTTCPHGEETRFLQEAGLETSGGDYSRMAQELHLAERSEGKLKLSKAGEVFVNLMQNDQKQARSFLHGLAFSKIKSYKVMLDCLKKRALTPEELFLEINKRQSELSNHAIDKQDLSTLLGLAMWCGVLDKKLALYYLRRSDEK